MLFILQVRAHKSNRAVLGEEPTRTNGVTNLYVRGFFISFKITNTKEREVIFMMTAIYSKWTMDLGKVYLDIKNLLRSTLDEVYFVIRKYTYLVFGRTLSEYVY